MAERRSEGEDVALERLYFEAFDECRRRYGRRYTQTTTFGDNPEYERCVTLVTEWLRILSASRSRLFSAEGSYRYYQDLMERDLGDASVEKYVVIGNIRDVEGYYRDHGFEAVPGYASYLATGGCERNYGGGYSLGD